MSQNNFFLNCDNLSNFVFFKNCHVRKQLVFTVPNKLQLTLCGTLFYMFKNYILIYLTDPKHCHVTQTYPV